MREDDSLEWWNLCLDFACFQVKKTTSAVIRLIILKMVIIYPANGITCKER